jgi:hypothetical protein
VVKVSPLTPATRVQFPAQYSHFRPIRVGKLSTSSSLEDDGGSSGIGYNGGLDQQRQVASSRWPVTPIKHKGLQNLLEAAFKNTCDAEIKSLSLLNDTWKCMKRNVFSCQVAYSYQISQTSSQHGATYTPTNKNPYNNYIKIIKARVTKRG